jgi:hypothetical protein
VILVFLTMLAILVLALGVVAFVAFPRNGEKVPAAPWLGSALEKAVRSLPTVSEQQHR